MTVMFPAPWDLEGNGYMFLYRFSKIGNNTRYFRSDFSGEENHSGFGTVMLVDYQNSTAGPYQELLFIPGKFRFRNKKYYSITKIYVSTLESVVNGRENWGIPKEQADFKFIDLEGRRQKITVSKDGNTIFEMTVKNYPLSFPVSTRFVPLPLLQKMNDKFLLTRFNGRGKGKPARIEKLEINPDFFPQIRNAKPIASIKVENFHIQFPVAQIIK